MPRLYRPAEVIRVLESLGWTVVRWRGSHVILTRTGFRNNVSVPLSRREVLVGTFKSILEKAELTKKPIRRKSQRGTLMALQKFTVVLIPDGEGYQVIVPHYPGCVTWGESPKKAFENAKEAMEMLLEVEAEQNRDPIIPNVHASHVVVGDIEVKVPDSLIEASQKTSVDART